MLATEAILSRDSFLLSIELRIFWTVAAIYGLSFIVYIFHIVTRSPAVGRMAQGMLWTSAVLHVALIAFRTFEGGRAPFQTLYETLSWFACSASVCYLFVSRRFRGVYLPGALVSLLASGASFYSLFTRSPVLGPLSPPLQSYWFEWHVILAFFSYAVFVVSASIEMSSLAARSLMKKGREGVYGFRSGMMDEFHSTAFRLVAFGFPMLTFAIFSGAAWANEAWGRYWSWDPKETWSLITWTVFTIYLHSRAVPSLRGTPASLFNILGFVCMIVTFVGVNWLARLLGIPSLHVYAV